jgi:hemolysin activation/secretion protein
MHGGPGWAQSKPAPAPQQDPRFDIQRFIVEGATLVSAPEIGAATAPFAGKSKDFADVQRALEAIERLYANKGYSAVQVILPEQELDRGEVHFKVVEAKIGKVVVEGNKFFNEANIRASIPALKTGVSPNVHEIAQSLKVANENPAKQSTALLRGGAEEGTVDAVIRITDEKPVKYSLTLDNTGTAETGTFRLGFGFQHANLWNRDHVLSAQYVISPHEAENPHTVRLWPNPRVDIYGMSYRIPLYGSGNTLDLSAGYSNVRSGQVAGAFGLFNVAGAGAILGMRYNINLPKQGELDHRVSLGIDWRGYDNRTTIAGGNQAVLPDVTVHPISATYSGLYRTAVSETSFYFGGYKNLPGGNDGDTKVFDAFRPGAVPGYTVWRFGIGHNQAFGDDWQGRFSMSGQTTRNRLISGEQFGIGGADSIRGFLEREVSNDSGVRYSVEAYTPDFGGKLPWVSGFRARSVFFYDWGRVKRFNPLPGEINQQGLASFGLGVRVSHGTNFSFRLDYGVVIDGGGNQGKWEGRPHATASYIF